MQRAPIVSFCIATHNRGAVVVDCLRRTLGCGLPESQFEILIVDNGSGDGTPEMIEEAFGGNARVQLIRLNSNCGPVAKNIAMRKARGEFVVLLDDDAFPGVGAVPQMVRHFREDKHLAAAVFDVTLPDGSKDAAAYPDVFIGAGTGLRRSALLGLPGHGLLPAHFFMQAEEYDLSFRLLEAGWSVQRFWDLPLTHLKTPNARIGQRTTGLDIRNNLYLLARYVPQPLAKQLAADWMTRYWMMAENRDADCGYAAHPEFGTHCDSFIRGAEEGLKRWDSQRAGGKRLLSEGTIERIFKFQKIRDRMEHVKRRTGCERVVFAEFGKNMLAYWLAAKDLGLEIVGILDDRLAGADGQTGSRRHYRGIPLVKVGEGAEEACDAIVMSNLSPVQAPGRAAALRRVIRGTPVVDLFSRRDEVMQGMGVGSLGR
jgi:hypothetical protein